MERPILIIGNWKMYKTIKESLDYFKAFEPLVQTSHAAIYLAVPFTSIQPLAALAKSSAIHIGAQNMHDAEEGAFTGEISSAMLKEAGARFVLLGHSERRRLFHENDAFINKKVLRAVAEGLQPILCVGETHEARERGQTVAVLRQQIQKGLAGVTSSSLVIAYEPVWAIGSNHAATPAMIEETHTLCREILRELFGQEAERIPILYGGSVTHENAHALIAQPNVDGLLVGGASLSAESFAKIVHFAQNRPIKTESSPW
jgi:triosephosphate isomerase